ncbi:hypothetical protein C8R44DRAFT_980064 [Mycena epipterygia]|nr:hypothetical protein C8R44DRAFT_980064 [Mycena epipterygia]
MSQALNSPLLINSAGDGHGFVFLRVFVVSNPNTPEETETEIEDFGEFNTSGFCCILDIFPVVGNSISSSGPVIAERSTSLTAILGHRFIIPAKVPFTTDGHKSLIFVYDNLGLRDAGRFVFRYRFFRGFQDPIPNSECYGSPFNVGPDPTPRTPRTAFTQHLVTHGALERYEMGDGK